MRVCFSELERQRFGVRLLLIFSTYFEPSCIVLVVGERANRQHRPKGNPMGIRKVNLNDLKGSLSQRGRSRFEDEELATALLEMLEDNEPVIWESAQVEGTTEKQRTASKMKWRNRANSVFNALESGTKISIRWTTDDEMVIIPVTD